MTNKHVLETKPLFRLTKVIFWLLAVAVVGLTILIWYSIASQGLDASHAYFLCNGENTEHSLTSSQQNYIQTYHAITLRNDPNEIDNDSVNKTCYQEYSGKDPDSATNTEVQNFRSFQAGSNGEVYTIHGIQHDWYLGWLIGILAAECILFQILKMIGLYVAGGKEALKP